MSSNVVTVTASFGTTGEGNYLFAASGSLMDSSQIAIVTPVVSSSFAPPSLGGTSSISVGLLASDNYPAGDLYWNCFVQVQGINSIHVTDFAVNFALGATQNLFTILAAAGWTPTFS